MLVLYMAMDLDVIYLDSSIVVQFACISIYKMYNNSIITPLLYIEVANTLHVKVLVIELYFLRIEAHVKDHFL